jgi:hypothetical protein
MRDVARRLVAWLMNPDGSAPDAFAPDVAFSMREQQSAEDVAWLLRSGRKASRRVASQVIDVIGDGDECAVLAEQIYDLHYRRTWWLRWRGDKVTTLVETVSRVGSVDPAVHPPEPASGPGGGESAGIPLEALFAWWRDGEGAPPDVLATDLRTSGTVELGRADTWLRTDHPRWIDVRRLGLVAEGSRAAVSFDAFHPIDRELYRVVWWVSCSGGRIETFTLVGMQVAGRDPPPRDLPSRFPVDHPLHGLPRSEVARRIEAWFLDPRNPEPDAFTDDVAMGTALAEHRQAEARSWLAYVRHRDPPAESCVIDAITGGDETAVLAEVRIGGRQPSTNRASTWLRWRDDRVCSIELSSAQVYDFGACAHPARTPGPDPGPPIQPALEALFAWWRDGAGPPPDVLAPALRMSRSRHAPQPEELLAIDRERWHDVEVRHQLAEGSRAVIHFEGFPGDWPHLHGMVWWVSGAGGRIATLTYLIEQISGGRERPT